MATATNYLWTSIGLIWDTLLPGVIPVTLYAAVQDRVTEVIEDTIHGLVSVLLPHQTQWSTPTGPAIVLPETYCILPKIRCHPGTFIVPEPAVHQYPMEGWTL